MSVLRLDHVAIRTRRLGDLVDFYGAILDLTPGPRPAFPFDGAWLYAGDFPVVHLVAVDTEEDPPARSIGLEHFAFTGDDADDLRARLVRRGVPFVERTVVDFALLQIVFRDPEGNRLHVDFPRPGDGISRK